MSNTIYLLEAANLYMGDHDPNNSKHLQIQELKLPNMQGIYGDHHPGGSRFGLEMEVGAEKLGASFKFGGVDMDALAQFGLNDRARHTYTAYGDILNKRTGEHSELVAVMEARLGKAEKDNWQRGEFLGTEYELNELVHYELRIGEQEIFYWDFFTNAWRAGGVDQNADTNRILRIPQAIS